MTSTILTFGIAREICGGSVIFIELPGGATAGMLVDALRQKYPALNKLSSFAIAVNGKYAAGDVVINPGDEIAVIPPVSGG